MLHGIKELNISSNSNVKLDFLNNMKNLERLKIYCYAQNITEFDLSSLEGMDKLTYLNFGISSENKINNINLEALKKLSNLKELQLNIGKTDIDLSSIGNISKLETLTINNANVSNLQGFEKLVNLKELTISQNNEYLNNIDTESILKIPNLKHLKINIPDDINWMTKLEKLEKLTLVARSSDSAYGYHVNNEFINVINNIPAEIELLGNYTVDFGKKELGDTIEYNLNDNLLLKELNNPKSKLYIANIQLPYLSSNMGYSNVDFSYDEKTKIIKINVNSIGHETLSSSITSNNGYYDLYFGFEWTGFKEGDKTKEIEIKDNNLKKALLKDYDIDKNEKITEHDMINIPYLELEDCNIEDISGLEHATNVKSIFLNNNKIKDGSKLVDFSKNGVWIDISGNSIEDITNMDGADFEKIEIRENYIDFSENSVNRKIVEENLTRTAGKFYDENKDKYEWIGNKTKEEYISQAIKEFFEYHGSNQKVKSYTLGDVNDDGKINARDAKMTLQYYTKKIDLTENQKLAADVNKDNKVNARDAKLILQYYTKKITKFNE